MADVRPYTGLGPPTSTGTPLLGEQVAVSHALRTAIPRGEAGAADRGLDAGGDRRAGELTADDDLRHRTRGGDRELDRRGALRAVVALLCATLDRGHALLEVARAERRALELGLQLLGLLFAGFLEQLVEVGLAVLRLVSLGDRLGLLRRLLDLVGAGNLDDLLALLGVGLAVLGLGTLLRDGLRRLRRRILGRATGSGVTGADRRGRVGLLVEVVGRDCLRGRSGNACRLARTGER